MSDALTPAEESILLAIVEAKVPSRANPKILVRRGWLAAELLAPLVTAPGLVEGMVAADLIHPWQPRSRLYYTLGPWGAYVLRDRFQLEEHWETTMTMVEWEEVRGGHTVVKRAIARRPVEREHWGAVGGVQASRRIPRHAYEVDQPWPETIPDPMADPVESAIVNERAARDLETGRAYLLDQDTRKPAIVLGKLVWVDRRVHIADGEGVRARARAKRKTG